MTEARSPPNPSREILHWKIVWQALKKPIEKALAQGNNTHSFEGLKADIESGRYKLFYTNEAVALMEIIIHPNYRVGHFPLAAGRLDHCMLLEARGCEWARSNGCRYATIAGREGWVRALKDRGWKREPTVLLAKEL